jgi:competence protein ComEC
MKYPFAYLLVFFALGSYFVTCFGLELSSFLFISIPLAILLYLLFVRHISFYIPILSVAFLLGIFLCAVASDPAIRPSFPYLDGYVTVTGRVCELPKKTDMLYSYTIQTDTISYDGQTHPIREKIRVNSYESYPYGVTIQAEGFLSEFQDKLNKSSFDTKRYYKSRGLFFKVSCPEGYSKLVSSKIRLTSLHDFVCYLQSHYQTAIDTYTTGNLNGILRAVLIGDNNSFDLYFQKAVTRTGASRFFNPAFLQVSLVLFIGGMLFVFPPAKIRNICLIALLLLYAAANQNQPIVLKSVVVMALCLFFTQKSGFYFKPDLLAIGFLSVSIISPLCLFDIGFLSSLAACTLLQLFQEPVQNRLTFIHHVFLRKAVSICLILTLGLLPINLLFTGTIQLYTLVFSLLLLPLSALLLLLFPPIFALVTLFPAMHSLYLIPAGVAFCIKKVIECVNWLPLSSAMIAPLNLIEILLFYSVSAIIYYRLVHRQNTWQYKTAILLSVVIFVSCCTSRVLTWNDLTLRFINVGQGDSTLLSVKQDTVLIDGGGSPPYSTYDVGEHILVPYLQQAGVTQIDVVIVSHYHKDHADGILSVLDSFEVNTLVMPDCTPNDEYRRRLEDAAQKYNVRIEYLRKASSIDFSSGLSLRFLAPDSNHLQSADPNDTSIVLEANYGQFCALFTGDVTTNAESSFQSDISDCDILKVAHHGSDTSTSSKFLKKAKPEYALIGVGENNTYSLPSEKVVSRLELSGTKLYRTDKHGDITAVADKKGVKSITSFKDGD